MNIKKRYPRLETDCVSPYPIDEDYDKIDPLDLAESFLNQALLQPVNKKQKKNTNVRKSIDLSNEKALKAMNLSSISSTDMKNAQFEDQQLN